ncbi:MAG: polysaccharide biosynthesis tyrosine autokinase, partial [Bacteroidia bacterium]|nr:polysaccharide biosynthesis tyrosine autokinase [Bacteroidia bacterium]
LGGDKDLMTEVEIIKSRYLVEKVVSALKLNIRYYQLGRFVNRDLYKETPFVIEFDSATYKHTGKMLSIRFKDDKNFILSEYKKPETAIRGTIGSPLSFKGSSITIQKNPNGRKKIDTTQEYAFLVQDTKVAAIQFGATLEVKPLTGTALIKLAQSDIVPERATDFLNVITKAYIEELLFLKKQTHILTVKFINQQLSKLSGQIGETENQLESIEKQKGVPTLSLQKQADAAQYLEYLNKKAELEVKELALDSLIAFLNRYDLENLSTPVFAPSLDGLFDQSTTLIINELNNALIQKVLLLQKNTVKSPTVIAVNSRIRELKNRLMENSRSIKANNVTTRKMLEKKAANIKNATLDIPSTERSVATVQRGFAISEKMYSFLLEKRTEAEIMEASTVITSRIIDESIVPDTPIFPNRPQVILGSLIVGLFIGIGYVILREALRETISYKNELESRTTLPIIGTITRSDMSVSETSSFLVLIDTKSAVTESFRALRTNIQFVGDTNKSKVISVTSTVSGEGKSFISTNLAAILSFLDKKVLIVDLDLRKPKLHKTFSMENEVGMSTLLIGRDTFSEVIRHTSYQNLDIITSGPVPPNPSELLSSNTFVERIEDLREMYDYIICDTSPVGLVTDSIAVLKISDVSLYVFRADYSKKSFVQNIEKIRDEHDLKNMFLVFNFVNLLYEGYGYGYGYTYGGYGYYSEDAKKIPKWRKQLNKLLS